MAKATASNEANPVEIIVEKYLATREDIPPELQRVFRTIYKGQTHSKEDWDAIINNRMTRPAV